MLKTDCLLTIEYCCKIDLPNPSLCVQLVKFFK